MLYLIDRFDMSMLPKNGSASWNTVSISKAGEILARASELINKIGDPAVEKILRDQLARINLPSRKERAVRFEKGDTALIVDRLFVDSCTLPGDRVRRADARD